MSLLPSPPIWLPWCYIYWFIYSFIYQGLGMCTAGSCGGQGKFAGVLSCSIMWVLDTERRSSVGAGGTFILWATVLPSPFCLLCCLLETVSLFSSHWCWTQDCSVLASQILRLQVSYHLSLPSLIVYYHLAHVQQSQPGSGTVGHTKTAERSLWFWLEGQEGGIRYLTFARSLSFSVDADSISHVWWQ